MTESEISNDDLKSFVKETIKSIVLAYNELSQEEMPNHFQGLICKSEEKGVQSTAFGLSTIIDFDIGLSAEMVTKNGSEKSLKISVLSGGLSKNSDSKNSSCTKIKFSLPVLIIPKK
jgi:hypothetical protein